MIMKKKLDPVLLQHETDLPAHLEIQFFADL